jgi:hypothetical protein
MSEATQSLLNDDVETVAIGTVAVRGKSAPLTIYSVPSTLAAKPAEATEAVIHG